MQSSCAKYTLNQAADDFLANVCKSWTNISHKFSKSTHMGSLLMLFFLHSLHLFFWEKRKISVVEMFNIL